MGSLRLPEIPGVLTAALALSLGSAPALAAAIPGPDLLTGDWGGILTGPGGLQLNVLLQLRVGPDGVVGRLASPQQGAFDIPVAGSPPQGGETLLDVPSLHAEFRGRLTADDKLEGIWTQGAARLPLNLTRLSPGAVAASLDRPQTPHPPFSYRIVQVKFGGEAGEPRLAGTLTLPEGQGPFPAVVLIPGSGPQTRDETVAGHPIFWVLADALSRNGFAVLRYDKRGVGQSGGTYAEATLHDFAQDARTAADWLGSQPGVDRRRLGLIGHSEGGLAAPLAAAKDPAIAFMVLLAAPGVDGRRLLAAQGRLIEAANGGPPAMLKAQDALREKALRAIAASANPAEARAQIATLVAAFARAQSLPLASAQQLQAAYDAADTPWMRSFLTYDPAPTLRRLRLPVLALIGSKDLQVPAALNLPALRAALKDDPEATVEESPGLNHLFQTATTGAPSEYGQISETFSPLALKRVLDWLRSVAPRTSAAKTEL